VLTSVIFRPVLLRRKVTTVKQKSAMLMLSFVLLVGCQYDPWANRFLTAQVADEDVAGTYVIDDDSRKRSIKLPLSNGSFPIDRSARIVLSSDHKAEFVHVPEDYLGKVACSVTGRGSWRLGKNDTFSVVRASIVNEEPNSPCKGDFAYELMLYGKKSPYKLHVTIGDPDSGDAAQFEKQH
jgi:hypothetical protein